MFPQAIALIVAIVILAVYYAAGVPAIDKMFAQVNASQAVHATGMWDEAVFIHDVVVLYVPLMLGVAVFIAVFWSSTKRESTRRRYR